MRRGRKSWLNLKWVERRPMKVKLLAGVVILGFCLVGLRNFIKYSKGYPFLFLASQFIHLSGIIILIFKLIKTKNCSGLSLKSQVLTAIELAAKSYSSNEMEDHTFTALGSATFLSTLLLIYMIRFKLKPTYSKQLDSMPLYFVLAASAILSVLIHPRHTHHGFFSRVIWSFSLYLAPVTVLPQLRLMQLNGKMVEPFTAYYVFALGVSRFLNFGSWVIYFYETGGQYLMYSVDLEQLWFLTVVLSEFLHTFILADFCYYYLKSVMYQQLLVELSSASSSLEKGKNI